MNPLTPHRGFVAGALRRAGAAAILVAACGALAQAQSVVSADPQRFLQDVKTLSAPQMEGRGDGSQGLVLAQNLIAARYQSYGLQPKGTQGYLQPFDAIVGAALMTGNRMTVTDETGKRTLLLKTDYVPFAFSAPGSAASGLVFAGYGITDANWKYDDYAGLDVKGKIVVVLRGSPSLDPARAPKDGSTLDESVIAKAITARKLGATAVVVVDGKRVRGQPDRLTTFGGDGAQEDVGIPVVQVRNDVADVWFQTAGQSLLGIGQQIDSTGNPDSFAFPAQVQASLLVRVRKLHSTIANVLAYLPGQTDEYVIIGAHYDHLGRGYYGSLAPSKIGQLFPGADDNASGTAAVMELARMLSPLSGQLPRGILFASFAGEELGLLGSAEWVKNPTLPLDKAVTMINMDMVGRAKDNTIYIGGVGTSPAFQPILDKTVAEAGMKASYSLSGYSSSDETSFLVKKMPVLFFFSGLHADYHKPSDTWDKIDPVAASHVINLVADTAIRLDEADPRPPFAAVVEPKNASSGSHGSGYGPYFGSIPDFGQVPTGVRFADVRPGSPAAKAGLLPGDVLIQFGTQQIKNLYDFTDALRHSKVGDTVQVTVLRDGKPLTVPVTLEERR